MGARRCPESEFQESVDVFGDDSKARNSIIAEILDAKTQENLAVRRQLAAKAELELSVIAPGIASELCGNGEIATC